MMFVGRCDPTRAWHGRNIMKVAALTEKNYDVNYVWGIARIPARRGVRSCPKC